MTQYRITTQEFTSPADGHYYGTYHQFAIGTLVAVAMDDGSQVPLMQALDGRDEGAHQYVPYACVEAI